MAAAVYDDETARFVESFAQVMVGSGMPRMASRIFAYLLVTDSGAATAAELADRLRASPAAISGSVRYLIQVQLAVRDRVPGERKDTYRLAHDLWYEGLGNRDHELSRWSDVSRRGAAILGEDTPAGIRLAETARFFDFLRKEMSSLVEQWKVERGGLSQ
jgi:hypothetical protein